MCHSNLVLDNKSCETSCPRGYYISATTSQSTGVYDNNVCTSCTSSCYECSGSSTSQCLSCPKSKYITFGSSGSIIGSCTSNSGTSTTLNLFVKASYTESTGDGSYSNPFGNIVKALSYADEQSADKGETTINIYLLNGYHFMTRNFNHYNYFKSKSSGYSYNQIINIQPAFCGQTLGGHTFQASDTDCISTSSKITVYYQMGNTFRFTVPKSMTVSNIIFDALDSSLLPTENCLKENARCCTISGTTLSVNPSNPNPASSCTVQTIQTEECKATFGSSFFQFGYSDTLSSISGVGTLTISNCVFQNFFYDFTSFIGLTKGYGKITITGTTFDKFSNCGSIIRDTREFPTLDYLSAATSSGAALTYRDSMFTMNQLQTKYFVGPSSSCTSTTCSSISLSLSTFTNFNYLKSGGHTYHKVNSISKMGTQGIIIDLSNFYGNVAINDNSFTELKFKYDNCEESNNNQTALDKNNIWGSPKIVQQKTIINILIKSSLIEIYNNSFIKCNSYSSIISIMRESSFNGGLLIHNNIFNQNSAYYGANTIRIYLYSSSSFYNSYTLTYMVCANVKISNNSFKNNVGCNNVAGVLEAYCYTDNYDYPLSTLAYYDEYPYPPYSVASYIKSKQGIVDFSTVNNVILPSSQQIMDSNKFLLTGNIYDQNFPSSYRSTVEIINFRRIYMESETYIRNSGQFCESLNKYGSIKSNCNVANLTKSNSWPLFSYFGQTGLNYTLEELANINYLDRLYPVSQIFIQVAFSININGIIFDNNAIQEVKTKYFNSMYPSGAITLSMCKGNLYISSLTIKNYKGFDQNTLKDILGTDYSNVVNYEPNQRDSSGNPLTTVAYPKYLIDYGFKNSLIKLARPSTASDYDYSNQFDICSFDQINLLNLTQYDPTKATPLFIDIDNDCSSISISNINIKDVDAIRGQTSIFGLKTYGSITITNGTIQNINVNTYSYNIKDFSYVPSIGGVFIFNSIQSNSAYPNSIYTLSNLTFDKIYGRKGGSFYFGISSQVTTAHNNYVSMNSIIIQNSISYESGAITFDSGKQFVTISKSNFISNLGINCEADIRLITTGSLIISDSTFKLFSSTNLNSGQSITLEMNTPFAFIVKVTNIIIKCSDSLYDQNAYISYINATNSQLSKQSPILLNPGSLESTSSTFSNCFNSLNGGVIQVSSDSSYTDNGSTFIQNVASSGGAIYFRKSTGSFTNTIFTYNYAGSGGAIIIDSGSSIQTFTGVTCDYNYANNGGCINSIGESSISISNSTFNHNYSNQSSSALYFLGAGKSSIVSSEISYNNANSGNTISLLFTPLTLTNVTFTDNISKEQSLGLFATFSFLTIQNSTFIIKNLPNSETNQANAASNSQITGCFILIGSSATLAITGSHFENGYSNYGGAIYISGNSDITISNSIFKNCYSSINGGAVYATGFKTFRLTSCNFEGNSCGSSGNDLCIKSGESHISNSKFVLKAGQSSISLEGGEFYGENIVMINQNQVNDIALRNYYWMGSGIYGASMNYFYLYNSSFTSLNYATYGGAIYLLVINKSNNKNLINPIYVFDSCKFESNSALFGGAIFLEEVEYASFKSCSFKNNSAVSDLDLGGGTGGALYYLSSTNNSKVVFESNNIFEENTALISGGAIYWNYIQPENVLQQTYSNNNAMQYGDNYGCFAQELQIISETEYKSTNSSLRSLNASIRSNSLSIINQQSGGTLSTFYIALVDQFNQIVGADSSSTSTITISGNYAGAVYSPLLKGATTQTASNGAFKFNDISFTAQPGTSYSLSISTTGIDSKKPSNAAYLSANSKTSSAMAVTIALRTCVAGESFSSTGACIECASPNYYSLEQQTSPGSCKGCQTSKMYCKGGSDVGPKPGYWRSSLTSDTFISCLYSGACLGYVSPSNNKLGECFEGYQGVLCADCAANFSKTSSYKCGKCPNPTWNIIRLLLIFLAIIIGIILIVRSTLSGALQKKNLQSVYIKLLMNHLQLLTLTSSFDLRWPDSVNSFFSSSNEIAQVSTQFLSFDCFLDQRGGGGSNLIRLYYQKMIMYAFVPLIMAACSFLFWTLYFCLRKKADATKKIGRIVATLIILFFLIHPTIVQYMFSNFNCKTIDSESRITDDLEVKCWGSEHILYSLSLAAPSLVIWGFGIPLYAWIILAKHREDIDSVEIREKYGFLYNGYKKEYYFWESINMYRKICVIFISAFLKLVGVITQALVIFLILIIFLILNLKLMPYTFQSLNDMEMISLITCMLTIYCGLFFISDMPSVYNSTDSSVKENDNGLRMNESAKMFFFIIILTCNLLFLIFWFYKMMQEVKNTMRAKMGKLYMYIFLCGDKTKLEEEKIRIAIQDENDILKEEFDRQLNAIKNLWNSNPKFGKLMLNKMNIQKSALYLHPDQYLKNILIKEKKTEDDIKYLKRTKRKAEGETMHLNLLSQINSGSKNISTNDFVSYKQSQNSEGCFESSLNKFLDLPNSLENKVDNDISNIDKSMTLSNLNIFKSRSQFEDINKIDTIEQFSTEHRHHISIRESIPYEEIKMPSLKIANYKENKERSTHIQQEYTDRNRSSSLPDINKPRLNVSFRVPIMNDDLSPRNLDKSQIALINSKKKYLNSQIREQLYTKENETDTKQKSSNSKNESKSISKLDIKQLKKQEFLETHEEVNKIKRKRLKKKYKTKRDISNMITSQNEKLHKPIERLKRIAESKKQYAEILLEDPTIAFHLPLSPLDSSPITPYSACGYAATTSDCYNIIYGCRICDSAGGLNVCTSCLDGYYLLTNTTLSGSTLSFCVPDCSLADPRYTNNPLTMSCQYCGDGCTSCNMKTGCEVCPGKTTQTSLLYAATTHPLGLSYTFNMCQS